MLSVTVLLLVVKVNAAQAGATKLQISASADEAIQRRHAVNTGAFGKVLMGRF
jgi:hypothetical protein